MNPLKKGRRYIKRLADFHSGREAKEYMRKHHELRRAARKATTERGKAVNYGNSNLNKYWARKSQKRLKNTRKGVAAGGAAAGGLGALSHASHKQNKKIKAHDDLRFN